MMPARSQNLLETYYNDGNDAYHYNSLRSDEDDEDTFNVKFTRTVSASGIAVNITEITGNFRAQVLDADIERLTSEVNLFQNVPRNGQECIALGWTYLGHQSANAANIDSAKASATASGYEFKSLSYQSGYFVFGCTELKLFYDQG
jgi:hypothetical protein